MRQKSVRAACYRNTGPEDPVNPQAGELPCGKHRIPDRWWKWLRCGHSGDQRSAGAPETLDHALRGHTTSARFAGKQSRSATLSTIHHLLLCLVCVGFSLSAAETNSVIKVQFDRDVRPILQESCLRCHGPERPKSGFRLDDRVEALRGGDDNTNDIVPGHSERSALIRYVSGQDKDIRMPPADRGAPLTEVQVATLKAWIDEGAPWGTNVSAPELTFSVAPELRWIGVQGNSQKFRELEGTKEGVGGGVDEFSVSKQLAPDAKLALAGHVRMPEHDIAIKLSLDQDNVGFVHSGFEEWRQYYNDVGGYYPLFQPSTFSLDRDLHLDIGRFWIDIGLTPPNKPQVVLGYEYQFRQGAKSTLAWGPVTQGAVTKNIYPDEEDISERTHIFKIDISDTLLGWNVQDRTRIEISRLSNSRNDDGSYTAGPNPDYLERVDQTVRYTQGANMLRVEKQVTDWWLVSGGGLLSEFSGTTLLNQSTINTFGVPVSGQFWQTEGVTLHRISRVVSMGTLLSPIRGLNLSGGAQGEWTHEEGFGNVNLAFGDPAVPGSFFAYPGTVSANQDQTTASEDIDLTFTRLPRTVLFAEARAQQESVGQFDSAENSFEPVAERTDALNHFYDIRTGLTASPWNWLELGGHARRRDSSTGYNNLFAQPGAGYPGFISHRDIALDELEGRIVLRPVSWWSARLTYDRDVTRFTSDTESILNPFIGLVTPGGNILDGRTSSDNFGVQMTFMPSTKFYLTGSATYGHTRTTTAGEENAAVVPYVGDTWTLNASAGYAINEKTSLNVTYVFSEAGYGQSNTAGLPLGLDFTRHELLAGIKRQITKNLSGALRYQFSRYVEPSSGTVNDFTANGFFLAFDYRWP